MASLPGEESPVSSLRSRCARIPPAQGACNAHRTVIAPGASLLFVRCIRQPLDRKSSANRQDALAIAPARHGTLTIHRSVNCPPPSHRIHNGWISLKPAMPAEGLAYVFLALSPTPRASLSRTYEAFPAIDIATLEATHGGKEQRAAFLTALRAIQSHENTSSVERTEGGIHAHKLPWFSGADVTANCNHDSQFIRVRTVNRSGRRTATVDASMRSPGADDRCRAGPPDTQRAHRGAAWNSRRAIV